MVMGSRNWSLLPARQSMFSATHPPPELSSLVPLQSLPLHQHRWQYLQLGWACPTWMVTASWTSSSTMVRSPQSSGILQHQAPSLPLHLILALPVICRQAEDQEFHWLTLT